MVNPVVKPVVNGQYAPLNWTAPVSITPSKLRTGPTDHTPLRSFLRRCTLYDLSAYYILYYPVLFVLLRTTLLSTVQYSLHPSIHTMHKIPPSKVTPTIQPLPSRDPVRPPPPKQNRTFLCCLAGFLVRRGTVRAAVLHNIRAGEETYVIHATLVMLPYSLVLVPLPQKNCRGQYKQYKQYTPPHNSSESSKSSTHPHRDDAESGAHGDDGGGRVSCVTQRPTELSRGLKKKAWGWSWCLISCLGEGLGFQLDFLGGEGGWGHVDGVGVCG